MKLTKKHIGRLFDCRGGDGSWVYQLIDVRKGELLFYSLSAGSWEIDSQKQHQDWRQFVPRLTFDKPQIENGWKIGRRTQ